MPSPSRTRGVSLPVPFERLYYMPPPLCDRRYGEDESISGVRCFGIRNNRNGEPWNRPPLMHNKFLVFARGLEQPVTGCEEDRPALDHHWRVEMVWTGSYNLNILSPRSRENAVIIRDPVIGDAFLREWAEIIALSEPLDWDSEWVDPQWRPGM